MLINQGLTLEITCFTKIAANKEQTYSISGFNNPYYYEPVFTLKSPIHKLGNLWEGMPNDNEFPINAVIEVTSKQAEWQFDVMFVYDAALE